MRDKNCEHGYWTAFPCDKCTIESLRTQLADALKRAEGAERERDEQRKEFLRNNWKNERDQARADLARVAQERDDLGLQLATKTFEAQDARDALARVTEDNNQLRDARAGSSAPLVRALNDLTAAQSRIQELERMVGMLRGALKTVGIKAGTQYASPSFSFTILKRDIEQIQQALSLTESQAAEVVRGMVEALKEIEWSNSDSSWHRDRARQALAALEAVRGNGGQTKM